MLKIISISFTSSVTSHIWLFLVSSPSASLHCIHCLLALLQLETVLCGRRRKHNQRVFKEGSWKKKSCRHREREGETESFACRKKSEKRISLRRPLCPDFKEPHGLHLGGVQMRWCERWEPALRCICHWQWFSKDFSGEHTHRHADHLQPIDFNAEKCLNVPFGRCSNAENSICIITCRDTVSWGRMEGYFHTETRRKQYFFFLYNRMKTVFDIEKLRVCLCVCTPVCVCVTSGLLIAFIHPFVGILRFCASVYSLLRACKCVSLAAGLWRGSQMFHCCR